MSARPARRHGFTLPLGLLLPAILSASVAGAQTLPTAAACKAPVFEVTLLGYSLAEIRVSTEAEIPQTLAVTLQYLDDKGGCQPLRIESVPPLSPGARAAVDATAATSPASAAGQCPTYSADADSVTFCIEATKAGNVALLRFDRSRLLRSSGLLGLTYETLGAPDSACAQSLTGPSEPSLKLFDKHRLGFDVGTSFSLDGDGGWTTNAEAAAGFRSRWYGWLLTDITFRYSAIGQIDDAAGEGDDGGEGGEGGENGGDEEEPDPSEFNPLAEGSGVFETDVTLVLNPFPKAPRLGLTAGAGFSTLEGGEDGALETRQRHFFGLYTEVDGWNSGRSNDTLAGATSWVRAGAAWDDLFEEVTLEPATDSAAAVLGDESERWFIEGEVELPRVGTEWLRVVVRAHASVPRSGDGPSDVRVAALASIDPRKWFGIGAAGAGN